MSRIAMWISVLLPLALLGCNPQSVPTDLPFGDVVTAPSPSGAASSDTGRPLPSSQGSSGNVFADRLFLVSGDENNNEAKLSVIIDEASSNGWVRWLIDKVEWTEWDEEEQKYIAKNCFRCKQDSSCDKQGSSCDKIDPISVQAGKLGGFHQLQHPSQEASPATAKVRYKAPSSVSREFKITISVWPTVGEGENAVLPSQESGNTQAIGYITITIYPQNPGPLRVMMPMANPAYITAPASGTLQPGEKQGADTTAFSANILGGTPPYTATWTQETNQESKTYYADNRTQDEEYRIKLKTGNTDPFTHETKHKFQVTTDMFDAKQDMEVAQRFSLQVTDSVGAVAQGSVTVYVAKAPKIVATTDNPYLRIGTTYTLNVTKTDGHEVTSYEWEVEPKDNKIIMAGTDLPTATYVLPSTNAVDAADAYTFKVTVEDVGKNVRIHRVVVTRSAGGGGGGGGSGMTVLLGPTPATVLAGQTIDLEGTVSGGVTPRTWIWTAKKDNAAFGSFANATLLNSDLSKFDGTQWTAPSAADLNYLPALCTLQLEVTDGDPISQSVAVQSIPIQVIIPGSVTLSKTTANVTEGGALPDTYTVVLDSAPSENVTVTVSGDSHLQVSPATLTFTSANWDTPQIIEIQAVDDQKVEGTHVGIITHTTASADARFDNLGVAPVTVTIADNDTATVQFSTAASSVIEANTTHGVGLKLTLGGGATITAVPIMVNVSNVGGIAVAGTNYTVFGATPVVFPAGSGDGTEAFFSFGVLQDGVINGDLTVDLDMVVADGPATGFGQTTHTVTIQEGSNLVRLSGTAAAVTEGGATDSYTVVLGSEPTANVTVTIAADSQIQVEWDAVPGYAASQTLTFTSDNWNIAQTINVQGYDDRKVEGGHAGAISHTTSSADGRFNGLVIAQVAVTITDNDTATVAFLGAASTAAEAATNHVVTLSLTLTTAGAGSAETAEPITVTVTDATTGSAAAGINYAAFAGTPVTFAAGSNTGAEQPFLLRVLDNNLVEGAKTVDLSVALTSGPATAAGQTTHTVTITDNDVAATVTNVTCSKANGTYGIDDQITGISVQFSKAVTVAGGVPTLTLDAGNLRAINYASGSGTNTLTFAAYTVQATDAAADLDYAATDSLALGGATIVDAFGNNADLTLPALGAVGSLSWNKDIVIDTTGPTVLNITSTKADDTYGIGAAIDGITVQFSAEVFVTGTPQLQLEVGRAPNPKVSYLSGSGTDTLTFSAYTVLAGDVSADLDYVSVNSLTLPAGASIRNVNGGPAYLQLPAPGAAGSLGANKALVIDGVAPTIAGATLEPANAYVEITFADGGLYKADMSSPVDDGDFDIETNLSTPGLTVTITPGGLTDNVGGALAGGENVIRVAITIGGGSPDGVNDQIRLKPNNGTSLYDLAGNAMNAGQNTGWLVLYP